MECPQSKSQHIVFGRFEVDLGSGRLLKNGKRIRLQPQPFRFLELMLARPGEVVTREEVCRALWNSTTFVDFDHSLGAAMNKIREALGDSADHPRFVETLPRRGYRFIGKINSYDEPPAPDIGPARSELHPATAIETVGDATAARTVPDVWASKPPRHLRSLLLVLTTLLAMSTAALLFVRKSHDSHAAVQASGIRSIAVLPLENLSGNPAQQYFADGMTDELITELAKNKGLRVISRTSVMQYKGVRRPMKDIARELGVDGILEGSVVDANGRVRVSVQLVHAASGNHVWAQSYIRDLSDLLLLQQEIAENVAKEVNSAALPAIASSRRIAPGAHDAYLRGRYNWYAGNYDTARQSFEKAIELQSDYATAYSGLADYYTGGAVSGALDPRDALPKGEAAAQKALQLDDTAEEAHNSMAGTYLFYQWNWKAAEKESQRAIDLNPNFAEAYHLYAYVLLAQNRKDEAVAAQQKSQELDPFARPWALGYVLNSVGRYDQAASELRQRSEAVPKNSRLRFELAQSSLILGREKESMDEFANGLRLEGDEKSAAEVRVAFARGGNRGVQEWRLARLQQSARKRYVSPLDFALAYARLRQDDQAFRWMEKAYNDHVPGLVRIQQNSDLNRLHGDPRYRALIKRIGLPASF